MRYFPPLLPICDEEDPVEVLHTGGVPHLAELRLHNGTVYRWNRPVYDVMNGRPHLRVENRVLPAGPTVVDMLANAAFYFGLVRDLAETRPSDLEPADLHSTPRRTSTSPPGAAWTRCCTGPDLGDVRVNDLVLRGAAAPRGGRAGPFRGRARRPGPAARGDRGALPHRPQRGDLADRDGPCGRAACTAWTGRRAAPHAPPVPGLCSAPTSRCTPGRCGDRRLRVLTDGRRTPPGAGRNALRVGAGLRRMIDVRRAAGGGSG